MALLAGTHYDPAAAVSKATSSLLAMTAFDTTNLRLTFTAPANGIVMVRIRANVVGATTYPQILLGVLDGATVKGRQAAIPGRKATLVANSVMTHEAMFLVTGLTPGVSYTYDAAYGVETVVASTNIKYGGPNDTTLNNAWGGITFEIWDTPMLLAGKLYDPAAAVSKSVATLIAMTAFDTTNLRLTFTAPASGKVLVRIRCVMADAVSSTANILLGVLEGATVRGRQSPLGSHNGNEATTGVGIVLEASFLVTGLTPGNSYTYDAAYSVDTVMAAQNIKYGGPNDTTTTNAWGGLLYEIWAA